MLYPRAVYECANEGTSHVGRQSSLTTYLSRSLGSKGQYFVGQYLQKKSTQDINTCTHTFLLHSLLLYSLIYIFPRLSTKIWTCRFANFCVKMLFVFINKQIPKYIVINLSYLYRGTSLVQKLCAENKRSEAKGFKVSNKLTIPSRKHYK